MSSRSLRFHDDAIATYEGKSVRRAHFVAASGMRLSSACDVANAARERFSTLFDCSLSVEMFEPVVVPLESRAALFSDATIFIAHGTQCDLYIVVRDRDAHRIVAAAFREDEIDFAAVLSRSEERVLGHIARELADVSVGLCGPIVSFARANARAEQYDCASYFELRFSAPVDVTVGIGLSRDPEGSAAETIPPAVLSHAAIPLRARIAGGRVSAGTLSELHIGETIAFDSRMNDESELLVGNVPVARGESGDRAGHFAFRITSSTFKPALQKEGSAGQ